MSAVIAREEILDVDYGSCAYTLGGSPVACAAALASLDELEGGIIRNGEQTGLVLGAELSARLERFAVIYEVRVAGLLVGIEVVDDRESGVPSPSYAAAIVYRCFELGLIAMCVGVESNVIELTPPLTLSCEDAVLGATIIERAVSDVVSGNFDTAKLAKYPGW